nr:MAG TPA: hypothetical protein [Caudoviricetes sp.]
MGEDWTRVEVGLPEPYKECWVTYEFKSGVRMVIESYLHPNGAWRFMERKYNKRSPEIRKPIAWMYKQKPKPYEEQEEITDDDEV